MNGTVRLKPMPFRMSVLFFGIPTLVGVVATYALLPVLDEAVLSKLGASWIWMTGPLVLLFVAALVAYRLDANQPTWAGLFERYRIQPIRGRDWYWTAGLVLLFVGGQLTLLPTAAWLAESLPLPLPSVLPPAIDPRVAQSAVPTEFFGVPLQANYWIAVMYLAMLFINIFGEELWWRGYILPRQEMVHGRWTWLVHGLLWTLFHLPFWWNLINLLPSTLSLSYVVSKLKNSTPGIIAHSVMNGLGFLVILAGVLGMGT